MKYLTYSHFCSLNFLLILITVQCSSHLYTPHHMPVVNSNMTKTRCFLFKDWNVYDLNPLRNPGLN